MSRPSRIAIGAWFTAFTFAVLARVVEIGQWPGLNADEAWYGVNVQEWLSGGTPFLHTGVGNPLSPIHSGLLLAFSTIFDASPAVLRMPQVMLGIAAVALANPLLGGPLGRRAAFIAGVLIAMSPTAIAYARLGWDPSATPFVTLSAIGCALRGRLALALIALAFAYLVHPTNVFVAPIVLAAWAPYGVERYRAGTPETRSRVTRLAIAAAVAAVPFGSWALVRIAGNPETPLPSIAMVMERLVTPSLWFERVWGAFGLASGATSTSYVAGPLPSSVSLAATAFTAIVLIGAIAASWPQLRAHRYALWLLAGTTAAIAAFHIVAIPNAFTPGVERYALFLLVPLLLLIAIAIDALAETRPVTGATLTLAVAVMMAALVVGGYFRPFAARGGDGPIAYRTGSIEPKLAAFSFIDADSSGAPAVRVIAEDWWLYWPLRYFAGPGGRIHVEPAAHVAIPGGTHPEGASVVDAPMPSRTYIVAFAGSGFPATMTRSRAVFTAVDPIARPIVEVFVVDTP